LLWFHYGGKSNRRIILPFFPLLLGLSMLAMAASAVNSGEIAGYSRLVHRDHNPFNFWGTVIICILGGLVLIAAAIWILATN